MDCISHNFIVPYHFFVWPHLGPTTQKILAPPLNSVLASFNYVTLCSHVTSLAAGRQSTYDAPNKVFAILSLLITV